MSFFTDRFFARSSRGLVAALVSGAASLALTLGAPSEAKAEPAACLSMDPKDWPASAKPYFLVAFDTSGSMGDAVTTATSNSCGYPNDRLGHGRCAMKKTFQAFSGLVNFGLASYARVMYNCSGACFTNCLFRDFNGNSGLAGCGPEPNANGNSSTRQGGNILVPIRVDSVPPSADNTAELVSWVDNNCASSKELFAAGNTPLNGILRDAYKYLSTSWGPQTYTIGGVDFSTPTHSSPLTSAANGEKACRVVNVLLVTDGAETCDSIANAQNAAANLYANGFVKDGITWKVKTHVIDFGDAGADADTIASAGGTVAAKTATNEAELSAAIAKIIGDAVAPEVCDNADNNCNGCTDEGFNHYCDTGQTCCNWANDAARTACLNGYKASITPLLPNGDLTLLPCTTPAQAIDPAKWLCFNPKEICDDIDNNCVGGVDDGVTKCGNPLHCPQAETCNAQDDDCDGIADEGGVCGSCFPTTESCDGCDNDCDGIVDNGIANVPCGFSPPNQCAGVLTCLKSGVAVTPGGCVAGGGFSACSSAPVAETCNGIDDNCNGIVDDGIAATPCVVGNPPPGTVYKDTSPTSQCQKGTMPCGGACTGFIGPSAEICDGIDNDCDGQVDEGAFGIGQPCGTDTGECTAGVTACVGGALVCQGGIGPQPESCDNKDNNCNGSIDELPLADGPAAGQNGCWTDAGNCCTFKNLSWCPPVGGTCTGNGGLTSPCNKGTLACVGGAWACQNAKGPTSEVCNGIDDNCNGQVDDGVGQVGQVCGTDTGECTAGVYQCVAGALNCVGDVGPTTEVCDNKDNDCDGLIDESAPGTGVPCGNNTPPCSSGTTACVNGAIICQGAVLPQAEVCDGNDNDCDGQVDEGSLADAPPVGMTGCWNLPGNCCTQGSFTWCPPAGATCNDKGALTSPCAQGTLLCQAGGWTCVNSKPPATEICDGIDNNCNGQVDDVASVQCTAPGTPGNAVFGPPSQCVKGTKTCGACIGAVGPTSEICDGIDNDCDGQVDEGAAQVGTACGVDTGECAAGMYACVNGALVCQGGVGVAPEICDGKDNDCDGSIDEGPLSDAPGAGQSGCWADAGNCCTFKNLSWCPPQGATCTGKGALTAPCAQGTLACQSGAWTCVNPKGPAAEACDFIDNNCDGQVDNVQPVACDPPGGGAGTVYNDIFPASQCSKGTKTCGACVGGVGPSPEVCDGIDNNCDGQVDNGIVGLGAACGINQPPCTPGATACVNGSIVCQGGQGPQPEVCDGIDNNCDGSADNAPLSDAPAAGMNGCWTDPGNCCFFKNLAWCPPQGATCTDKGSLTAPCNQGSLACAGAAGWVCQNPKGPAPEACDGLDNNCNGIVDDGNFPQVGQVCGSDVGECKSGLIACTAGVLTCVGATIPTPEICDGLDNDCNTQIDNGVQSAGPCEPPYDKVAYPGPRNKGACKPGTLECTALGYQCVDGIGPAPETCDGIDNDCDGSTDEMGAAPDGIDGSANPLPPPAANIGDPCGVDEGICQAGVYACLNGNFACVGGQGPQPEECDCNDNNCDGQVDNFDPNGPALCNPGKDCVATSNGCQCAAQCGGGENQCPPGQKCEQVKESGTGKDLGGYCVTDYDELCGKCEEKIVPGPNNTVLCAPAGTPPGANCVAPPICECKGANGCQEPCFNVACDAGKVCSNYGPNAGECVTNNCWNAPCLGCDKACDDGACVPNPCAPNNCPKDQACKPDFETNPPSAICVPSCANVSCPNGEACVEGVCKKTCDPPCGAGEVCDTTQDPPKCINDQCNPNPCIGANAGAYCDPLTGDCMNFPCEGVICPMGQECQDGSCIQSQGTGGAGGAGGSMSSGSSSSGSESSSSSSSGTTETVGAGGAPDRGAWGLATGGGGCQCELGAGLSGDEHRGRLAAIGLLLMLARLRKRRRGGFAVASEQAEVSR